MKERDSGTLRIPNELAGKSKRAGRLGLPILGFQCVGERAGDRFFVFARMANEYIGHQISIRA
jgi:hypothetical protein